MLRCRVHRMSLSLAVIRSAAERAPGWTRQQYKCFFLTLNDAQLL